MSLTVELFDLPAHQFRVFWGASGSMWQSLWDRFLDFTGDNPLALWTVGSYVYTSLIYWSIGLAYTLLDVTGRPAVLRRYKVQPGTNEPVDPARLRTVIRQVLFNQFCTGLPLLFLMYYLLPGQTRDTIRQLPTFVTVVWQLGVCILIEEVMFYYSHRLLHDGRIYRYIHKRHHEWTAPIAITAMYAHPVENVLSNLLPIAVGVWTTGCHISVAWLWFTLAISNTLHVHSGYHLPLLPSPEQHDYHHLKFNQCYGVLGVLDWLHGTSEMFHRSKQAKRDYIMTSLEPVRETHPDQ
ncbi:fatty acid hydroxylase domain-containing protein 2-like [Anopheles merus]|nr:fatty acid hydroxylase domain-containing protein 2-like [Anopheles merus]